MKILLLPNESPIDLNSSGLVVESTNRASLDGYFYDYFHDFTDAVVGFRYWLDGDTLTEKSIFRFFANDGRVLFDDKKCCVDMLFDSNHIHFRVQNKLKLDSAQDFGGIEVVQSGQSVGILFSL